MTWLRLDASAFHDRAIRRAGSHGRRAFIAALMLSRERDWRKGEDPGWLPASEFDATEVALHWGERTSASTLAAYTEAIRVLAEPGGPFEWAGDGWRIAGWRKYQPDPTALARQRKLRSKKWKDATGDEPACHGDTGQAQPEPKQKKKGKPVTGRNSDPRNVTPRDVDEDATRRDEDETSRGAYEGTARGSASASAGGPASASPRFRGSELHEALLKLYRDGCPTEHRVGLDLALKMRANGDPGFEDVGNSLLKLVADGRALRDRLKEVAS